MDGRYGPTAVENPAPGDYFVTATGGWQAAVIRFLTQSPVNHAGIYLGGGAILEAEPRGATVSHVSKYPYAIWSRTPLTVQERLAITARAWRLQGTPYNYLDIVALGLALAFDAHIPAFVKRRLARSDRLICSQLVDYVYDQCGVHLFSDGRLPENVTPGDLYRLIQHGAK